MAKGKIVKQWATFGANPSGGETSVKVPISLTVGDGHFHIPLPDYVCEFFGPAIDDNSGHGNNWAGYAPHDLEVAAKTMDVAQSLYQRVIRLYCERAKNQNRKKVIIVNYKATRSHKRTLPSGAGEIVVGSDMDHLIAEISFAKGPALELTYEVLWESNGGLYRVYDDGGDTRMTYMTSAVKIDPNFRGRRSQFQLDWTEEREAFFANARDNMNRLIAAIAHMLLGDTESNIDRMITQGGGLLSLPAPQEND